MPSQHPQLENVAARRQHDAVPAGVLRPSGSLNNIDKVGPVVGHLWPRFGPLQSPYKTDIFYFHSLEAYSIAFLPKPFSNASLVMS